MNGVKPFKVLNGGGYIRPPPFPPNPPMDVEVANAPPSPTETPPGGSGDQIAGQPLKQRPATPPAKRPQTMPRSPIKSRLRSNKSTSHLPPLTAFGLSKFGSHTIESEHLVPPLHTSPSGRNYQSDPFFNNANRIIRRGDARVMYDAAQHGVVISSTPIRRNPQLGVVPEPPITMVLGGYTIENALVIRTDILTNPSIVTSVVDASALAPYTTSGVVTDRTLGSALNPIFQHLNVSRAMAGYIIQSTQRYDNTLLYAKGSFLAQQGARVAQEHVAVNYTAYPPDAPVVHIDIDAVGINVADLIGNEITEGSFIPIAGKDFKIFDLDIVYWLACPGRRSSPAAVP